MRNMSVDEVTRAERDGNGFVGLAAGLLAVGRRGHTR